MTSRSGGAFLPTTIQYPTQPEELLNRLNTAYEDTATRLNLRQIGVFDLLEFSAGELWFNPTNAQVKRRSFRRVYSIGAIAAGATSTTAHGLVGITAFTHIYGTCVTAVVDYRPIPYASATAVNQQIEIKVDATNITIINGAAAPNITSAIVVLEYLKN